MQRPSVHLVHISPLISTCYLYTRSWVRYCGTPYGEQDWINPCGFIGEQERANVSHGTHCQHTRIKITQETLLIRILVVFPIPCPSAPSGAVHHARQPNPSRFEPDHRSCMAVYSGVGYAYGVSTSRPSRLQKCETAKSAILLEASEASKQECLRAHLRVFTLTDLRS